MAWPSIEDPSEISAAWFKGQKKTRFETGRQISRAMHNTGRRRWNLVWQSMSQTDLDALLTAAESDTGETFSWTHPLTAESYTVGYAAEEITFKLSGKSVNRYEVRVALEEH